MPPKTISIYMHISSKGENTKKNENSIINDAKAAIERVLRDLDGINWGFKNLSRTSADPSAPDISISLRTRFGSFKVLVTVKSSGEPRFLMQFAGAVGLSKIKGYRVFVASFISERGRALCKEFGLGYIDFAGNAYLNIGGILIERTGCRNSKKEKRALKMAFTKKSTRLLRIMFVQRAREWTVMELSKEAGVSLGQVSNIIIRLAGNGYLTKARGKIFLARPGDVLDAWTAVYRLEDHSRTGYYCPIKERGAILDRLRKAGTVSWALTLGAAASLVAPAVRSTDVYIYVEGGKDKLIKLLDLEPVEFGGNVYLVEPLDDGVLMGARTVDGIRIVSDLQLYLDLFNYPMRGREQAEVVRERLLNV